VSDSRAAPVSVIEPARPGHPSVARLTFWVRGPHRYRLNEALGSPSSLARTTLLSASLLVAALVIYLTEVRRLAPVAHAPFLTPWWILTAAFAVSEMAVMHLHIRGEAHSISLREIAVVFGLCLASPEALIAGYLLGSFLALTLHRRQPLIKLAFNLSQFALEATVALVVFHRLLPSRAAPDPGLWAAAMAAVVSTSVISALSVTLVISIRQGRTSFLRLPAVLLTALIIGVTNSCLGLVTVGLLWQDRLYVWLLAVIGLVLLVGYRVYASLNERHTSLALLYEFTRSVGQSPHPGEVVEAVLRQARGVLRAEIAEIIFLPTMENPDSHVLRLGTHGPPRRQPADEPLGTIERQSVAQNRPAVLARNSHDAVVRECLANRGIRDALVAPLRAESGTIGIIRVINRQSDVDTFDGADARVLETIVNHASVALENGRLVDRLRHEALHDPLTGLPNRSMYRNRVDQALRQHRTGDPPIAVMLMDLDRFKEVNDTLGHYTGDLLLQEMGARLRRTMDGRVTIARLGGDEFGVLLPRVKGPGEALAVASDLRFAIEQPFRSHELTLEVSATIGIALSPDHGENASTLLRRADVAMYSAKASQAGSAMYDSKLDGYTPDRLALVAELRQAIADGVLSLYYQPKAGLPGGALTGAEALIRWPHPKHGLMLPDTFIPLAEHTGLIASLTTYVLRGALHQCRQWADNGLHIPVAVNLSARSLLDLELPDRIARMLTDSGVPPNMLTLEVTEGSVMTDAVRTVSILKRLDDMDVNISVDDFGMGYSSLSYLKRLPINEIKIDKSFILHLTSDIEDAMIVRSIVDLGRNLGMSVVAEGVENEATWLRLAELGCDRAQGYYLSAPIPADEMTDWAIARVAAVGSEQGRPN
jgi:diguanylate cyclase (GGDEF)-like protein